MIIFGFWFFGLVSVIKMKFVKFKCFFIFILDWVFIWGYIVEINVGFFLIVFIRFGEIFFIFGVGGFVFFYIVRDFNGCMFICVWVVVGINWILILGLVVVVVRVIFGVVLSNVWLGCWFVLVIIFVVWFGLVIWMGWVEDNVFKWVFIDGVEVRSIVYGVVMIVEFVWCLELFKVRLWFLNRILGF